MICVKVTNKQLMAFHMSMALPNRMSLRPSLLWLTINHAQLFSVYHEIFFLIYVPPRCLCVPQVEYHCFRICH
jgi:hypothetical protein